MTGESEAQTDDPYTVERKIVTIQGETGRPEVFVEVRRQGVGPGDDVSELFDSSGGEDK